MADEESRGPSIKVGRESARWVAEGIISAEQRERILAGYIREPGDGGTGRMTTALVTIGALLLGIGVILFFASNWKDLSAFEKLCLLMSSLFVSYASAMWLEVRPAPYPRAARALYFLGSILYGSSIFLVAQAYNIRAHWPNGVLFWALGVIPLALVLSSKAISALGIVALSFWIGSEISQSGMHWWGGWWHSTLWLYGMTYCLWGAALIAASSWLNRSGTLRFISRLVSGFGVFFVLGGAMAFTFRSHGGYYGSKGPGIMWTVLTNGQGASFYASLCGTLFLAALSGLLSTNIRRAEGFLPRLAVWGPAVASVWAVLSLFLEPGSMPASLVANLVFLLGLAGLLYVGYGGRASFCVNLGMIALAFLLVFRYFDYAWSYMQRSAAFVVGGVLFLVAGFLLERGRRRLLAGGGRS
jgi:uncharacterized membrane protein